MSLQNIVPYRLPNHKNKRLLDPHVVIVGAGASRAACKIDKNGKEVPLLKDVHKILGLTSELKKYNFSDEQMKDIDGKPHFVYSWKLEPTDKLPKGIMAQLSRQKFDVFIMN